MIYSLENFNPLDPIILEDERVCLRPLASTDKANLLPFALQEPELWQFSLVQAIGETGLNQYIQQALAAREAGNEYPFIVFDKKQNAYAGSTRYYDIQRGSNCLQLGYTWYGRAFQRTGLNWHCKFLLLSYAFDTLQVDRVEFRADNDNERSIRAMKRIGCQVEGVLRSNGFKPNGKRRDSIVLSILRTEWNEGTRARLQQLLLKV